MSRFISFNNIIVWKDNQHITINIQSGTVLGGDAVNMCVALHGNTGPVIIHHGLVRTPDGDGAIGADARDRKSTRLNSSHVAISYAVFCLKKKKIKTQ